MINKYLLFVFTILLNTIIKGNTPFPIINNCLSAVSSIHKAPCSGQSDGSIAITVTDGHITPYKIEWTNGTLHHTESDVPNMPFLISQLGAGLYQFTVTNGQGCTTEFSQQLMEKPPITFTDHIRHVSCAGGNDGAIFLNLPTSRNDYSITWSSGVINDYLKYLSAGKQTVWLSDKFGCTVSKTYTITEPPKMEIKEEIKIASCWTGKDGSISLKPKGGTPPYTYLWENGATTATITNLATNMLHAVNVYDANGCKITWQSSVIGGDEMKAEVENMQASTSCAASDGTISFKTNSPSNNFTYSWHGSEGSGNGNGLTISSLKSGVYNITLTDDNGCFTSILTCLPSKMQVNLTTQPLQKCGPIGDIKMQVNNGTPPYYYNIGISPYLGDGPFQGDFVLKDFPPGKYTIAIRDAEACYDTATVNIVQAQTTLSVEANSTPVKCYKTGTVSTQVSGGTPPYKYEWHNLGIYTGSFIVYDSKTYTVTVTDANGCTASATTHVGYAPNIKDVEFEWLASDCNDYNGGILIENIGNGQAPYNVSFKGPNGNKSVVFNSFPFTINGLSVGQQSFSIRDNLGCTFYNYGEVLRGIKPIKAEFAAQSSSTCASQDGQLTINITRGKTPFSIQWGRTHDILDSSRTNIKDSIFTLSNLHPGSYIVRITDADGCQKDFYPYVPASGIKPFVTAIAPSSCTQKDGAIRINITGGLPNSTYTYWMIGKQFPETRDTLTTPSISIKGLLSGHYDILISQANCYLYADIEVPMHHKGMTVTGMISNKSCISKSKIDLTVSGGQAPFRYNWDKIPGGNDPEDLSDIKEGHYTVTITESNGCTISSSFYVEDENLKLITYAANPDCHKANGSLAISAINGQAPYTWNWAHLPGQNDPSVITGLGAGIYRATVTDANGCTGVISEGFNDSPYQALFPITDIGANCDGKEKGAFNIDLYPLNWAVPAPPYTVQWMNTGTGVSDVASGLYHEYKIKNLDPGTYLLLIVDSKGCYSYFQKDIGIHNSNLVKDIGINHLKCPDDPSGQIIVNTYTSYAPYQFYWENVEGTFFSNDSALYNVKAGRYRVTITNNEGCVYVNNNIEVLEKKITDNIKATVVNTTDCVSDNGSIIFQSPIGQALKWHWSTGATTPFANQLPVGLYTVTITDIISGCSEAITYTINPLNTAGCGYIKGRVIRDQDGECDDDNHEPGLSGWFVKAKGKKTFTAHSNASGDYALKVDPGDTYLLSASILSNKWAACQSATNLFVGGAFDTLKRNFVYKPIKFLVPEDAGTIDRKYNDWEHLASDASIYAYPIPANDYVNIEIKSDVELSDYQLFLYDTYGHMIRVERANTHKFTLIRNGLPPGMYSIEAHQMDKVIGYCRIVLQ